MKLLAIGAHQDDNEFRCGGLAHKLVQMGHEVRFLSLCNGCGGHHIMTPEETSARRAKESAAVAEYLNAFYGITMLCDIGNGTMNILRIANGKPDPQKMYTEKYGTHQCTLLIREAMMKHHHTTLDDVIITEFLQNGYADIPEEYLETIQKVAEEYSNEILHRLRDHDYDPKLMRLHVVGGGGCLLKNFMSYDTRVYFEEDICATAKGYEYLTEITLKRGRKS